MANPTPPTRELDIVVHGATGFVGRLVAKHLANHAPEGLRIGLSGRSLSKLERIRSGLGVDAAQWPLLVADAADAEALAHLAQRTAVVATTVGPYWRYGFALADACAQAGTHYLDLTGEVLFVRRCSDELHDVAAHTGARIVNACGFDSIPSDLAVHLLSQATHDAGAGGLTDTTLVLLSASGGFSGGTVDSLRAQSDATRGDAVRSAIIADPFALSPDRSLEPDHDEPGDAVFVERVEDRWVGAFVMASFNTRIVRRSNALTEYAYGREMRYREVMSTGGSIVAPVMAAAMSVGLAAGVMAFRIPALRPLVDRVLPAPGDGPDEKTQERGHFTTRTVTVAEDGSRWAATIAAQGDPGYRATSVMMGESAIALALGEGLPPSPGGVLTPATAMGDALVERLRSAGLRLEVERA